MSEQHVAFHDPRLRPQENKAVEMLRNGFSRDEIAEELDIDRGHLKTVLSRARRAGVYVPMAQYQGRPPSEQLNRLVQLREQLRAAGHKRGVYRLIAERVGLNENNVYMRLYYYDRRKAEGRET